MLRFILGRIAVIPPALLLVHAASFVYAMLAQRVRALFDPFHASVGAAPPVLPAYLEYMQGVLQGDLGQMPGAMVEPLARVVFRSVEASLSLLLVAFALSVVVGLLLGLRSVHTDPPRVARWLVPLSTTGLAMPSFLLGSLFIAGSLLYMLYLNPGGKLPVPLSGYGLDLHLLFPVLALMLRPTTQIAHMTGVLLSSELNKQYIIAARSLGYSWRRIRTSVAWRNVQAAVVLSIGGTARLLIAEVVLVEWLFGWPGMGRLLATALTYGTSSGRPPALFLFPPLVSALVTLFAAGFLLIDLVVSVLVRLIDPRLRVVAKEAGYR